jgi:hypothetical protein
MMSIFMVFFGGFSTLPSLITHPSIQSIALHALNPKNQSSETELF